MKIQTTIEKLELKPGDLLVATARGNPTREDLIEIQKILVRTCKACGHDDIGLLVKGESFKLEVVRMKDQGGA